MADLFKNTLAKAENALSPVKRPLRSENRGADVSSSSQVGGPWENSKLLDQESFFKPLTIDGLRWDRLYPYRLIVVKQIPKSSKYAIVGGLGNSKESEIRQLAQDRYQIAFEPVQSRWVFQLPITPQQLSITNMFSINTSATLRGIVEEHSGTRFKMISCSGTFGVWPYRRSQSDTPESPTSLQTLFGGTLEAFSSLKNQALATVRALQGKTSNNPPPSVDVSLSAGGFAGTGYANALLLDQFLEQYAELKKHPDAASYRLAFDIPKQNQTYLITPMQFSYAQSADSPNEYKFNLQLKAFKRVQLQQGAAATGREVAVPAALDSNTLQNVLNSVTQARRTLGAAFNLVKSVRSDVNGPFTSLRETALFVKGLAGLTASIVDLPDNIISDAKFAISDSMANLESARVQALATNSKLSLTLKSFKSFKNEREGQPLPNTSESNLKNTSGLSSKTSPINNLFDNPSQNFDLFNALDTTSVNFSSSVQDAIDNEIARVSLLTVDDLQTHKAILQELAYQISNAFGTGDATFNRIFGKAAPKERLQEISIDEYDVLKNLYDAIQNISMLTMNDDVNQNQNAAYEFVKAEAQEAGITFQDSSTKIRVPVPFGLRMEQIAARYLGDQERWLEIATINALKSPYIDEDGFIRSFLSNGDGRQFNVSSNEDLYVGQKILILSDTQPRQTRIIINVERINDTNFLVTVDGLDNLEIFTTTENARMHAYLPGTVNSQDQIFIPSELPVTDDLVTRPISSTQDDALTGLSRVDLLLTDGNDIAVNSFGDFRLSYGVTNLFQALKIKFITEPGNLIAHPDFGSGIRPGMSTAETSASEIYNTISLLIAQDPRYSGIERLQVSVDGPYLDISLSVYVANGLGVFPISFRLAA